MHLGASSLLYAIIDLPQSRCTWLVHLAYLYWNLKYGWLYNSHRGFSFYMVTDYAFPLQSAINCTEWYIVIHNICFLCFVHHDKNSPFMIFWKVHLISLYFVESSFMILIKVSCFSFVFTIALPIGNLPIFCCIFGSRYSVYIFFSIAIVYFVLVLI